ncbi:hypothetical protein HXA31_14275 [Salipaludibacillus agaradhaerens]|uniref:Uncharacterized protein n=1 Tax=Salipaludibacillus agaradhaerens TaxID=76935 RepID=A0A9Q4G163_SALAG|nr:hypothetical protein [Salipaludibacillus agaradhaerens]MCR6098524.1 hypothetical protein [Salipaludibacillus agaradhaerens]MCR6115531.1 hypothetical protein [Salipaludibacillus agaradhaerens]
MKKFMLTVLASVMALGVLGACGDAENDPVNDPVNEPVNDPGMENNGGMDDNGMNEEDNM